MQNKSIKLELTVDEVNLILESLGQLSFNKVFQLVGKIQQQAGEQLNEKKEK